jgi:hypothetical protein
MQETLYQSHFIDSLAKKIIEWRDHSNKNAFFFAGVFSSSRKTAPSTRMRSAKRLRDLDQLPAIYNERCFCTDQEHEGAQPWRFPMMW